MPYNVNDTGHVAAHNQIDVSIAAIPAQTTAAITAQAEPIGLSAATKTAQSAAYKMRGGNTIVGCGDNITFGQAVLTDGTTGAYSYLPFMHLALNGRVRILKNVGRPGATSATIASNFATDVIARAPRKVLILCGTNDALGATRVNLVTMIEAAINARIEPILGTIPPIGTAAIAAPATLTLSTATTGGTIAPGTYGYRVAALNAIGTTLAGTGQTVVVPAGTSTNTVTLNWSKTLGATSYNVYGRTAGSELLMATVSNSFLELDAATGYTDTGAATPSGALPSSNTTAITTPAAVPGGKVKIASVNALVASLAELYGLSFVDFHSVLVDPLTGLYKTGYTWDGINPTPLGGRVMGAAAAATLAERFEATPVLLPDDNTEPSNLLPTGGLLLAGPNNPPQGTSPGGWSAYGGTATAYTLVTALDAAVLGKAFTISTTDTSQHISDAGQVSTGFTAGDVIEVVGRVKTSGIDANGGTFILRSSFGGVSGTSEIPSRVMQMNIQSDIPWSSFRYRAIVPVGTTFLWMERLAQGGSFSASIAQLAIRNLTALGVA